MKMTGWKTLSAVALIAALSGCATKPAVTAEEVAEAKVPLICTSAEQCTLYWRRAQAWIAINSRMKIQIATDTVLETYNPVNQEPVYGWRLVRVPTDNAGSEHIQIRPVCGNLIGCHDPVERIVIDMKRFIRKGA